MSLTAALVLVALVVVGLVATAIGYWLVDGDDVADWMGRR
jgi:hypothetical protein